MLLDLHDFSIYLKPGRTDISRYKDFSVNCDWRSTIVIYIKSAPQVFHKTVFGTVRIDWKQDNIVYRDVHIINLGFTGARF